MEPPAPVTKTVRSWMYLDMARWSVVTAGRPSKSIIRRSLASPRLRVRPATSSERLGSVLMGSPAGLHRRWMRDSCSDVADGMAMIISETSRSFATLTASSTLPNTVSPSTLMPRSAGLSSKRPTTRRSEEGLSLTSRMSI